MLSRCASVGLIGLEGVIVTVEVDSAGSFPSYEMVGLPDAAVRESRERVKSAVKNSGFAYPIGRIVVSLSPADLKKEGAVYDLSIAVGMLIASGQLPSDCAEGRVFMGELGLDGAVRPVNGILPMVLSASREGYKEAVLPYENIAEAAYIDDIKLIPSRNLKGLTDMLRGITPTKYAEKLLWKGGEQNCLTDFADIKGQQGAKRAAEVAAAGGHNMLLIGTPGSGKTMLARAMPSILPELTFREALDITRIHSVAGALRGAEGMVRERPFRAPHHSASTVSLIGGGSKAMPGEISLAHYGVLFLDEMPEFHRDVLESLRQPLEDGFVTITRSMARSTYPADFMLIAAMNPCPCGNYGSRTTPCRCSASQIERYRNRISSPLLDRIDLHCEMGEVGYHEITSKATEEPSSSIRARVNEARRVQAARYKGDDGVFLNAQLSSRQVNEYCRMDEKAETTLKRAFNAYHMSARGYTRTLKVARTIADLAGSENIGTEHIMEAIQYRSLDSKYWSK